MKKNNRIITFILLIAVLTSCIYSFSPAASAVITKNGSITLHITDSATGTPLENATFRLYFFAAAYEKPGGIGFDYVVPYDDCNMDMDNLQDAYLPIHLTHFANTHSLPYTEKTSDKNGHIFFGNLTPGVYLIVPSNNIENYFMPTPFVINIPVSDRENKNWIYDINATPKMVVYNNYDPNPFTYISVKKVWDTVGEHPEYVTVSLLKDFTEVDVVVLNKDNNWTFRWDKLSTKHNWSVVETSVPDGYKVSYETSSNTVTIINKSTSPTDTPPPGTTSPSDEPASKPPEEPTTKPEELIDTGQLNWPVPVLSIMGLLFFSLGWAMVNLGKKEEAEI